MNHEGTKERRRLQVPVEGKNVVIYYQAAPRSELIVELSYGSLRVRGMLDHAQTKDNVERPGRKGQLSDVRLCDSVKFSGRELIGVCVDCVAEVNGCYSGAAGDQDFGKTPSTTATFKNMLARKAVPEIFTETSA
jgi:hypothetical protein